jgi:hypothetical protein
MMLSRADDTRVRPDVNYMRNRDTSLAHQIVGDGSTDLLLVSGFVSNLEYAWECPSLARFLSRLAVGKERPVRESGLVGDVDVVFLR